MMQICSIDRGLLDKETVVLKQDIHRDKQLNTSHEWFNRF